MNKLTGVLAGLLVPAFMLAAAVMAPATAQEKAKGKMEKAAGQVTIKEISKNDKFRVYEAIFKPGDEGPSVERPARVVRALTAGTLERTYPDGKKETAVFKAGQVDVFDTTKPYALKNVGKTTLHLYVVSALK